MGDIAGIVVGATAGLAFLILLVFCLMRCARPKRDRGVPPDRGELQRRAEEGERLMMVQGGSSAWKNRLQGVNEEALMGTRANEDDIRRLRESRPPGYEEVVREDRERVNERGAREESRPPRYEG